MQRPAANISNETAMPIGERDKKLIDTFPEAILLVEKQARILSANRAALELFGGPLDRLVGSDLSTLVTDDSSQLNLYLRACSRAAHFHIGSFQVRSDLRQRIACRFDGALLPWPGENILLLRLTPRTTSSTPFIALNEQIESLNRARHGLENEVRILTAELLDAQTKLQELSAQLMLAQDEERRRLARDLHDSTGQTLTAIQLNLSVLMNEFSLSPENRARIEQTVELTNHAMGEVRTISHLLHPPMLDEAGLCIALRTFVEGFEERSGIAVATDLWASFERLSPEMETALFRIVQECLTNVHQHSGSKEASIRLARENGCVVLEVTDVGRGMSQTNNGSSQKTGVGIRGMRERVRLLNGVMEFLDARPGTLIRIKLPCPPQISSEPGADRVAAGRAGVNAN
jgi:signal transduction histidine kinase